MKNISCYSDQCLLELIAKDDEHAFEVLFDRYWETAHYIALAKLKSKEVTQEIVHDLFLNFWERRHALHVENFSHYLKVSIKYKVLTYIKQQFSQKRHLEEFRHFNRSEEEATLQTVEFNDLMKALEEGVKVLPEKTQQVFRLNRLEGLSISEIADQLNLSEKAIEYHITRSRKELRLYLKDFLVMVCIMSAYLI